MVRLGWSPSQFWAATPHEFWAAYEQLERDNKEIDT
jgi:hypothetical protein